MERTLAWMSQEGFDADANPPARAYPAKYVSPWKMKDGTGVTIRPIRPEDEPLMVKFHEALSERSVYLRYFHYSKLDQRVAHDRLVRMCFLDYDREIALLAECVAPDAHAREILAIGRMSKLPGSNDAEIAFLVRDQYQRRGLGAELLRRLIQIARDERLERLLAYILLENTEMQSLVRKAGFRVAETEDPSVLCGSLDLNGPSGQ
jgi:acetyltransferase